MFCTVTQVTWPEAAAQRSDPSICPPLVAVTHLLAATSLVTALSHQTLLPPKSLLSSLLCFPYKMGGKSLNVNSLWLGEGRWVHSKTQKGGAILPACWKQ